MESKTLTTPKLKELQGPKVRFKQPLLGATIPRNFMSFRPTVMEKSCKTFTHSVGQNLIKPISAKKDTIWKGISRGTEWRKFQLHSTFHCRVNGPQIMTSFSVNTPYYIHGFLPKLKIWTSAIKDTIWKGISRETQWRKFQLHSTFHCRVKGPQKMTLIPVKTPYYSPWFLAKTENLDFGQKGYHMKGHLKRNTMAQISAS